MTDVQVIDCSLDFDVIIEDGDGGIELSQIIVREHPPDASPKMPGRPFPLRVLPKVAVLNGNHILELPAIHSQAAKNPKRAKQMVELAIRNTNRRFRVIRHTDYVQIFAPPPLMGSEVFALNGRLAEHLGRGPALLLCVEGATFAALPGQSGLGALLRMAAHNRVDAVLRWTWDSNCSSRVTLREWFDLSAGDDALFTLGAQFT
jgi:hypothetical protein